VQRFGGAFEIEKAVERKPRFKNALISRARSGVSYSGLLGAAAHFTVNEMLFLIEKLKSFDAVKTCYPSDFLTPLNGDDSCFTNLPPLLACESSCRDEYCLINTTSETSCKKLEPFQS